MWAVLVSSGRTIPTVRTLMCSGARSTVTDRNPDALLDLGGDLDVCIAFDTG